MVVAGSVLGVSLEGQGGELGPLGGTVGLTRVSPLVSLLTSAHG
jgi:hypothetical protein